MHEYKEIEELIIDELIKIKKYPDDIVRSPHFLLSLVWQLGVDYYHYIDILNIFFDQVRPKIVYYRVSKGFISDLIVQFSKILKIDLREYSL